MLRFIVNNLNEEITFVNEFKIQKKFFIFDSFMQKLEYYLAELVKKLLLT